MSAKKQCKIHRTEFKAKNQFEDKRDAKPLAEHREPNKAEIPVLYSFRRCPYAIRARLALAISGQQVEHREVELANKPTSMLQASPKATVPVLVFTNGKVIEESLEIMHWALNRHDPNHWLKTDPALSQRLVKENDGEFKTHLDHYKYSVRFPKNSQQHYRQQGEVVLQQLENRLQQHAYLISNNLGLADAAIFPFIRQFAFVNKAWFDAAPYPALQHWLENWLASDLFIGIMTRYQPFHD